MAARGRSLLDTAHILAASAAATLSVALISAMTLFNHLAQATEIIAGRSLSAACFLRRKSALFSSMRRASVEPELGSPARGGLPRPEPADGQRLVDLRSQALCDRCARPAHFLVWPTPTRRRHGSEPFVVPNGLPASASSRTGTASACAPAARTTWNMKTSKFPSDVVDLTGTEVAQQDNRGHAPSRWR